MPLMSLQSFSHPVSTFQSAPRAITYLLFFNSLFNRVVSVSLVLWGVRTELTEQALLLSTEDRLCLFVGPTHLFLRTQEFPQIGFPGNVH